MIINTNVYVDSNQAVPTHVITATMTTTPSTAQIRSGNKAFNNISFDWDSNDGRATIRYIPTDEEERFYIKFDTEALLTLDTLYFDERTATDSKDDSGDHVERKQRYEETGAPGVYDEETGMIDVTELGELRVPLCDLNQVSIEYQLLGTLADRFYPDYISRKVMSFDYTLPYYQNWTAAPASTFGTLKHPSMRFYNQSDHAYILAAGNSQVPFSHLEWEGLNPGNARTGNIDSGYRLIARNLSKMPMNSNADRLIYDDVLYEYDYFCDFRAFTSTLSTAQEGIS